MRRTTLLFIPLLLCVLISPADAGSYYISPTGANSASGASPSAPWRTFAHALPQLQPGDTLLLMDGTYTAANSGLLQWSCNAQGGIHATNGTATAPITLKALNERKAHVHGDGSTTTVYVANCAYWVIEGLYASNTTNTDMDTTKCDASVVTLWDSHHITLRRNLAHNPNIWCNSGALNLIYTHHALVEENEVYFVVRHGLTLWADSAAHTPRFNTMRRNYFHSRNAANLPGSNVSTGHDETRGDAGISCYPCRDSTVENNIMENWNSGFDIQGTYPATNNRYLGNIVMDTNHGLLMHSRSDFLGTTSPAIMPKDIVITDQLVVNAHSHGIYVRATKNTQVSQTSIIGSDTDVQVKADHNGWDVGDGQDSVYGTNLLVAHNGGLGFYMEQASYGFDYILGHGNGGGNGFDGKFTHVLTTNPKLGACKVFIPLGSPAKGAGKDGADIGATILYRYVDGVLTTTPLWEGATGHFPCGAIVPGVNDVAGQSCFDVHTRLGIPECPLPLTPPHPGALTVVLSQMAYAPGGHQGYVVAMQTGTGAYQEEARLAASTTSHTVAGLNPAARYCFTLAVFNTAGDGPPSPAQCTTPNSSGTPTGAPTFTLSTATRRGPP